MTSFARNVTRIAAPLAALLALARPATAQAVLLEPFAGVASGPSATAGASVWSMSTESIGFRGSVAWVGATDALRVGGTARGGVVLAVPVAGGPPIRPYFALDAAVTKRKDIDAYLGVRPAIGVIFSPGARLGYVVEAGLSINRRQPDEWSAIAGIVLSR
jgi:hypothetical protein